MIRPIWLRLVDENVDEAVAQLAEMYGQGEAAGQGEESESGTQKEGGV